MLANLALDGIEDAVRSALGRSPNARQPAKAHVVRYADDFIVTGATRELLERRVKPAVEEFLAARGLQLAPEKTLITHISRGFDFLGQNVRKYGNKLLIKPARKSVTSLLNKGKRSANDILARRTRCAEVGAMRPRRRALSPPRRHSRAVASCAAAAAPGRAA